MKSESGKCGRASFKRSASERSFFQNNKGTKTKKKKNDFIYPLLIFLRTKYYILKFKPPILVIS